ncbi:phage DNA ejection protein [Pectobacterium odoriferum]|uniref:phage DNA ejection protein n=1 Tax=Pectobacterium odoriferum TaxID=78398 RepID=UPI0032EBA8E0
MAIGPIDYSGGNGFLQGLRAYSGMQEVQQQRMQAEQAAAQQAALKAFQTDWKTAYGDPAKMDALVAKYPGQLETIKNAIGFRDDNHKMALGNAARDLRVAMASNNPQAVQQAATQHAQTLASIGSSPQEIMQQLQSNPQGLAQTVDAVGMSALGAKDFYGVQNDRAQRQNDADRNAETARSNRVGEAQGWANVGIAQQNANIRKAELQGKAIDAQIARETNQVKLAELQDRRAQNQREVEQARTDKADAYNTSMDTMSRTIDTANKVLNSPGFTGYFGVNLMPGTNRWIPGTDAADTSALVDTLKSQGFMSGIQQMRGMGALSNAEGQKVMDAIGNLSASQSEKSARASIKSIIDTTQMAQKRLQQKYGKDIPTQNQQTTQQQQLSDDALVNKYLGGR